MCVQKENIVLLRTKVQDDHLYFATYTGIELFSLRNIKCFVGPFMDPTACMPFKCSTVSFQITLLPIYISN